MVLRFGWKGSRPCEASMQPCTTRQLPECYQACYASSPRWKELLKVLYLSVNSALQLPLFARKPYYFLNKSFHYHSDVVSSYTLYLNIAIDNLEAKLSILCKKYK